VSFILDRGTKGLEQSKPLRKMGMHSSPTGQLFLDDVRVPKSRLLGESEEGGARKSAKDTFGSERTGVAAMALGIIERCLELCKEYAKTRVQFGKAIGEFQLIQLKLAKMEVARMNVQNLVFRQIELAGHGKHMDLAEASAAKLYSAQSAMEVCLEAVQLFGGNGYMAEYRVEQLCRTPKCSRSMGERTRSRSRRSRARCCVTPDPPEGCAQDLLLAPKRRTFGRDNRRMGTPLESV
jgi:alkylation response protein AidB-like acyl-CoA dehydrogenase